MKKRNFLAIFLASFVTLAGCSFIAPQEEEKDNRPVALQFIEAFVEMGFGNDSLPYIQEVAKEDVEHGIGVSIYQNWLYKTMEFYYDNTVFKGYQWGTTFLTEISKDYVYSADRLFFDLFRGSIGAPAKYQKWNEKCDEIAKKTNSDIAAYNSSGYDYQAYTTYQARSWTLTEKNSRGGLVRKMYLAFGTCNIAMSLSDYIEDAIGPDKTELEATIEFEYLCDLYKTDASGNLYVTYAQVGVAITEEPVTRSVKGTINDIKANLAADGRSADFEKKSTGTYIANFDDLDNAYPTMEELRAVNESYYRYIPDYLVQTAAFEGDPESSSYEYWFDNPIKYYLTVYKTEDESILVEIVTYKDSDGHVHTDIRVR